MPAVGRWMSGAWWMRIAGLALLVTVAMSPRPARADTPAGARAAIQAVCDRAAASYSRGDITGYLAMFTPDFTVTTVTGTRSGNRQTLAQWRQRKRLRVTSSVGRCAVRRVTVRGNKADVALEWSFTTRVAAGGSRPAYTYLRHYWEQTVWVKAPAGWREARAQITQDVLTYRR